MSTLSEFLRNAIFPLLKIHAQVVAQIKPEILGPKFLTCAGGVTCF